MSTDPDPQFARDFDLVREVLFWAERGGIKDKPNADSARLAYHCHLLHQAGLIESAAVVKAPGAGPSYVKMIGPPTMKGHDVLAAIRNDTIWNKVKAKLVERGIPLLFDLVVSTAKEYARNAGVHVG